MDDIHNIWKSAFSERKDYLRMLTKMFDGKLNPETHKHLKFFYKIVPPLMINYIESMLIAKEKLNKRNAPNAYLTDDGFAMGLAYLLHVLEEESTFKSLHWFATIHKKFKKEIQEVEEAYKMPKEYAEEDDEAD